MGWAYGIDKNGREVGYGVDAKCDEPNCPTIIDRGLAYRCGSIHTDEGCGLHFCANHLFLGRQNWLCRRCFDNTEEE